MGNVVKVTALLHVITASEHFCGANKPKAVSN